MNVLVTGGAGYIGSHAVRRLAKDGFNVFVWDDLSHGFEASLSKDISFSKKNINDPELPAFLKREKITAVLHFAAFIEVGESVQNPAKYYSNNFSNAHRLLESVVQAGIQKFVFSSTAATYGTPIRTPIDEDHPQNPINPYGRSKLMVEWALRDFAAAYDFGFSALRYFNVAGASEDASIGEAHEPESHLIPRILKVAHDQTEKVQIYGTDYPTPDGTCIRDYIHIEDLIDAHLLALNAIEPKKSKVYNLGSEKGFSVREVIEACRKVTGRNIASVEKARRPGDPAVLVASSSKIRSELHWVPKYPDLETIVRDAWNWHQQHPNGY